MSIVIRSVSGYCPYLDAEYSISVNYAVIRSLSQHEPGYKPIGFECDESESCPYGERNKCPIYEDELATN
jgi:hypothetical protein